MGIAKGIDFLIKDQKEDGSWGSYRSPRGPENHMWTNPGTHRAWTAATTGLVCTSLMGLGESAPPAAGDALVRGIDFLIENAIPKRVSEWDVDNTWAYVYTLEAAARSVGFAVGVLGAA